MDRYTSDLAISEREFYKKRAESKSSPEYKKNSSMFDRAEMLLDLTKELVTATELDEVREDFLDRYINPLDRLIINEFVNCAKNVRETLQMIQEEAKLQTLPGALIAARGVADSDYKDFEPEGDLELSVNYPLAIEISTTKDEDYKKIAHVKKPGKEGGNFKDVVSIFLPGKNEVRHVPLIVLRKREARIHEENHANDSILISAFLKLLPDVEQNDNKTVYFDSHWGALKGFNDFLAAGDLDNQVSAGESLDLITQTQLYINLLKNSFSEAKFELLADVKGQTSTSLAQLENIFTVRSYDPLRYFNFRSGALEKRFYADREKLLRSSVKDALGLQQFYVTDFVDVDLNQGVLWEKRQQAFRLFLAQLPVEEWSEWTKDGSILDSERLLFRNVLGKSSFLLGCFEVTKNWKDMSLSNTEENIFADVTKLRNKFEKYVFEKSDNLVISGMYFYKYKFESHEKALKRIGQTRLEKYMKYKSLVDGYLKVSQICEERMDSDEYSPIYHEIEDTIEALSDELKVNADFNGVIERFAKNVESLTKKMGCGQNFRIKA